MKTSKLMLITLRIIFVFVVGIIMSYFGDQLHSFFGDNYCTVYLDYHCPDNGHTFPTYHWGWRHWLFMFMGICLFILQVVDIVITIDKKE